MLLTPLLPRAGPTGGLGLACPAPTMSFTIWSAAAILRAMADLYFLIKVCLSQRRQCELKNKILVAYHSRVASHYKNRSSSERVLGKREI